MQADQPPPSAVYHNKLNDGCNLGLAQGRDPFERIWTVGICRALQR